MLKKLKKSADDLGAGMAKLSFTWVFKDPNVRMVIAGAGRAEQVHENIKSPEDLPLLTHDAMN